MKIVTYDQSFATCPKSVAWSTKNLLKPEKVFLNSNKQYWFSCLDCNHDHFAYLRAVNQSKNLGCPFCSIPTKKLCEDNECNLCFENSFASSPKHYLFSKDNDEEPRFIFKSSSRVFLFDCNVCFHRFKSQICHITTGCGCPFCAKAQLCSDENCKNCFERSFASVENSKYWSDTNEINPRDVFKGSGKKFMFDCSCGHTVLIALCKVTSGKWCIFCAGKKICFDEDCKACFEKSFAAHPKALFWSIKNEISPRQTMRCVRKKIIFDCDKCNNEFVISLESIIAGSWCATCKFKTERKLT